MENEVDIKQFINKLIDLTDQEKCTWESTTSNHRYVSKFKNGSSCSIEASHTPTDYDAITGNYSIDTYEVKVYDENNNLFVIYKATENSDLYEQFCSLYSSIINIKDKHTRIKLGKIFNNFPE